MSGRKDFGDFNISDELFDDSSFSSSSIDLITEDASSDNLPIKRGLSQFFQGKSESFRCLSEVSCIEDLAKKKNPYYSRRTKYCKRNDKEKLMNRKSHYDPNICSRIITN